MARPRHIPAPDDVGEVFSCAGLFIKAKTEHDPPASLGQIENSYKNARRSLSARSEVDYEQELSRLDRFVRNDDLESVDALGTWILPIRSPSLRCLVKFGTPNREPSYNRHYPPCLVK